MHRQRLGVEWLRLVAKAVGNGDERAVVEIEGVEPPVGRGRARHPEREIALAGGQRTFDEERAERFGGALDGAELGVQPIQEPAGRSRNRCGRQIDEERALHGLARGLGGGAIALKV
jgi:hypothetical protein